MYPFARETRGVHAQRRDQLTHPPYKKPELLATASNQLWSWGHYQAARTRESGPISTSHVILDVFSRYITGWMVAMRESAELMPN